ncbi:DeoR/GlpR transcriptional regulator [Roseomonas frigidaquae]|uniref:DeoR/GlpR transcriptional regulator n=1 Tax=Falsiroseomonas frigidaquae TaxID=487318 RepID=A0ABX1EUM3_9PROT|nr:DeoR/GlpR family DNA-binding transcription regulator [Falsiroseomonas frigidaquae]NKE43788.1 DeoR/GlpR transcriptional regulator [Falsiroseomonas frigidaquae]
MDQPPEQDVAANPRQQAILRLVAEQGFATIEALARRFGTSAQTARRDIIQLSQAGLLQRFHGGAGPVGAVRLGYAEKRERQPAAKSRIGTALAALLPPRQSLFLDVGTTVEAAAVALAGRGGDRIFTNSMVAALAFARTEHPAVHVLPGRLGGGDGSLVGGETAAALANLSLDVAVIACSGFDAAGAPMDFDPEKVAIKRAAMAAARMTVLLCQAEKFGRGALVRVAPAQAFATLLSDEPPPEKLRQALLEAGVELRLA